MSLKFTLLGACSWFEVELLGDLELHIWLPFVAHNMFLMDGAELPSDNIDSTPSCVLSTVLFKNIDHLI